MPTQPLPLKQLSNNPYQLWPLDPDHVADLAAEYVAGAPLPPIVVRRSPAPAKGYEIAVGHHRVAARLQLHLADVDAEVRDLTDLEMARLAIAENFKRRVPSAIDKARALQRLTSPPFHLSQAQAAEQLGYANKATVSHLLRLLELPAPLQAHVHSGALPERLARGLVSVARSLPQVALAVADQVAQSADDKESVFDDALGQAVQRYGRPMWDAPWRQNNSKADFTGPITYVADVAAQLGLTVLPACKGCEFHLTVQGEQCARPACFDAKSLAWKWAEVAKAAKTLGVTLAAPGEQVKLLFDGAPDDKRRAEAALKSKHASLRLVPTARAVRDYESETRARADLLGSKFAALATTDWPALKKALPESVKADGGGQKAEKPLTQAERDKKWKAESAARQAKQKELERLVTVAAEVLAPLLPDSEPLLLLLAAYHSYAAEFKGAKTLKARKLAVMRFLIDDAQDIDTGLFGKAPELNTPDGLRAGLVALLGLFKKPVPAALAAPPEPKIKKAGGRGRKAAGRPAKKAVPEKAKRKVKR
jgi:ParB/RepB/Spo0J family partition protein